ncbi:MULTISPECIES: hypothetical protein [Bradyrhizobium]|uniref:hypothetical protein n=1 Tax=Bradyrhizobium TaxID=374 RepID=UPI00040CE76B|nr:MULTISPECIES: hypothetical protein [Bradyrhizobium]MBR1002082.1 hypothetical protein [Bradyrhizobium liaoningense]MCP1743277.1 hypothetical protein [Bradyrhizobium japonicum]MCP1860987.1 hypothetical protein [Bradyrhizobium japonicum]MCP1891751.1 hypothetical protein [Bradyrhizobium japonicum]MCW2324787.1 hypothetical protein [Bradyrhizobium japonicum]
MSHDPPLSKRAAGSRKALTAKTPNAMKHGAFASIDLLPWESAEEFAALRRGLFEKYSPDGPLQEDCIASIASLMWRKRRVQKKRELDVAAELDRAENSILWKHPLPLCDDQMELTKQQLAHMRDGDGTKRCIRVSEEYDELVSFSCSLYRELGPSIFRIKIGVLPSEFADHLNKTCPEENYETTSHWVAAVKREVDTVLLPLVRKRYPAPVSDRYYEAALKVMNEERLFSDLAAEERIERNVDQLLGRFFKLQMADEVAAHRKNSSARMIEGSFSSGKAANSD